MTRSLAQLSMYMKTLAKHVGWQGWEPTQPKVVSRAWDELEYKVFPSTMSLSDQDHPFLLEDKQRLRGDLCDTLGTLLYPFVTVQRSRHSRS